MRIKRGLELDVDTLAVLSHEAKHIFINQSEAMPSICNFLQRLNRYHDLIGVDKLCDFDKRIASLMVFADGAN